MEVTQPMQRKKGPLMTGCGVLFGVCCCFSKVISSAVWRLSLPMSAQELKRRQIRSNGVFLNYQRCDESSYHSSVIGSRRRWFTRSQLACYIARQARFRQTQSI